jgi:hypothetical protein
MLNPASHRLKRRRNNITTPACVSTAPSPAAANLFARNAGVLVVDKNAVDRLNRIDEAITLATLPAFKPVVAGEQSRP